MPNDGRARIDVGRVVRAYSHTVRNEFRETKEGAVRHLLASRLPGRYGVGEGVVVDTHGGQSKPFDAVIFDRDRLPILSTATGITIWPFESVYAAVEVKETLTREGLESAVEGIALFKRLEREKQTSASATGFTVGGELANPPVGLLVAHAHAEDLLPCDPPFNEIVTSVARELQIDVYCVVSGPVGCLGQEVPTLGLLLGFSDAAPTKLYHFNFGSGALTAFLMMTTAILNKIQLGDPSLLQYLRAAAP